MAAMREEGDRLVYSTDQPYDRREVPKKAQPRSTPAKAGALPNDGVLRTARERRKAGVVTVIYGLAADELEEVARLLKRRCGGGGTAKEGVVTLQGDHRDAIVAYFTEQGRRCKKAGG